VLLHQTSFKAHLLHLLLLRLLGKPLAPRVQSYVAVVEHDLTF
jgi:hypothetical protein